MLGFGFVIALVIVVGVIKLLHKPLCCFNKTLTYSSNKLKSLDVFCEILVLNKMYIAV